ncbi:MAG TPA: hypothetical protein VLJ57_24010 [Burkholderiaceae bacterium]|nr:hypothetical protein [Burkholderiaceae bacterium]
MAGWFALTLTTGAAATGLSVAALTLRAPAREEVLHNPVQREAQAQGRLRFEFLVQEYLARNPEFVGEVTASQLQSAHLASPALRSGDFPPSWRATVVAGGKVTWCTPLAGRSQGALAAHGFSLESLKCAS